MRLTRWQRLELRTAESIVRDYDSALADEIYALALHLSSKPRTFEQALAEARGLAKGQ